MQRTLRSLIHTFLTAACALSLSLTGFDLPAQAEVNNDSSSSAASSSHAAAQQKKRRHARRRSRSARSTVAQRREITAISSASVPVAGAVKSRVDYIPPGGGAVYGEPNAVTSSTGEPPPPRPPVRGEIRGGILNGKAISLPKPVYPAIARSAHASGTVIVQVTIDETGRVMSARAVSGHPLLQATSVQAAYQARFSPTQLSGQPVKVTGTISYNFVQ
ncbi:MAG: periplasmic protein TonB [Blastocatellia bacterium]|jgi:TonB family protein|nr:periplasmic protein TonB [Blastocatellia bacterium]